MTAPAQSERIQIETNIPVTFTPRFVDYQKSQKADKGYPDQIRIKTTDGGVLWLSLDVATVLVEAGVLRSNGTDRYGNPAWTVLKELPITYTRHDKGRKPDLAINGFPYNVPAAGPVKVAPVAATPPPPPADPLDKWAIQEATYGRHVDLALRVWTDPKRLSLLTDLGISLTFEGLVAAAATNNIGGDKRGLQATPSAPAITRAELDAIPAAIRKGQEQDEDLPF